MDSIRNTRGMFNMIRAFRMTPWFLIVALALSATVFSTSAQTLQRAFRRQVPPHERLSELRTPVQPSITVQAMAGQIFLPLIVGSPTVGSLTFSSNLNGTNPSAIFDYGITELFVTARVTSGAGMKWRTEWTLNGEAKPNLGNSGILTTNDEQVSDGICYGLAVGPDGQVTCGERIPRGRYKVDLFLNDQFYQSATAVIR